MANATEPVLDEIQWRAPPIAAAMQGIHSNSVLFYFAESPFFDRTSNNAMITNQAMFNQSMMATLATRESFEEHLSTMSGLQYVVAESPAEMAPGTGTGVWVIRKQWRKKNKAPVSDDITPIATYFVVGENIYQAPTLADILSFRIESIAEAMNKVLPAADNVRTWTPSLGHVYQLPTQNALTRARGTESKEGTPMPDSVVKATNATKKGNQTALDRLAEESFAIHMRHGGDYIDENPITGRPGEFHLSSTGRKEKIPPQQPGKPAGAGPILNTKLQDDMTKDGKATKSPKTPTMPKPKRRKSKAGASTAAS